MLKVGAMESKFFKFSFFIALFKFVSAFKVREKYMLVFAAFSHQGCIGHFWWVFTVLGLLPFKLGYDLCGVLCQSRHRIESSS
jgi:hypothetical protein